MNTPLNDNLGVGVKLANGIDGCLNCKLPPHDEDSEKALLGCMLIADDGCLPKVRKAGISKASFYPLQHKVVFEAIANLASAGKPIDIITVQAALRESNTLNEAGGIAYLASLPDKTPSANAFESYADIVRRCENRRLFIKLGGDCQVIANNEALSALELSNELEIICAAIQRKAGADKDIPFVDAAEAVGAPEPEPPVLVSGLLHKGSKLVLGGGSKSFKTWSLVDLAISVATGSQWWGMDTVQGRVLYLNFEVQGCFFTRRVQTVAKSKGLAIPADVLHIANLRGLATDAKTILPRVAAQAKGYSLILLDPLYKLLAGRDENAAGDMSGLMNELERLAVQTGAAVAFGAHFSKGNQAGKESIDRISGSGVFARDPDALLVMTRHEEDGAFTVESTLRNFPPMEPFCVRWNYPLMKRDGALNPSKLKQVGGRPKQFTPRLILDTLKGQRLSTKDWQKQASLATGISRARFYDLLGQVKNQPELHQTPDNQWYYEELGNH